MTQKWMAKQAADGREGHDTPVEDVVAQLLGEVPGVRRGKMFGMPAFFAGRRLFACVYDEAVVLKLPERRVAELLVEEDVRPFQPYGKAIMREWVEIRRGIVEEYAGDRELLLEAFAFVSEGA